MNCTSLPKWLSYSVIPDTILTNTTFSSHITTTIETNMLQVAANSSVACPAVACGRNLFFSAISLRISDQASLFILFKYLWISLMHCLGLGSARSPKAARHCTKSWLTGIGITATTIRQVTSSTVQRAAVWCYFKHVMSGSFDKHT